MIFMVVYYFIVSIFIFPSDNVSYTPLCWGRGATKRGAITQSCDVRDDDLWGGTETETGGTIEDLAQVPTYLVHDLTSVSSHRGVHGTLPIVVVVKTYRALTNGSKEGEQLIAGGLLSTRTHPLWVVSKGMGRGGGTES